MGKRSTNVQPFPRHSTADGTRVPRAKEDFTSPLVADLIPRNTHQFFLGVNPEVVLRLGPVLTGDRHLSRCEATPLELLSDNPHGLLRFLCVLGMRSPPWNHFLQPHSPLSRALRIAFIVNAANASTPNPTTTPISSYLVI